MPPHMTAYKSAPYKKKFGIIFLQDWKVAVFLGGSGVRHCLLLKKITRLKPLLIKNKFPNKKIILINLDYIFWSRDNTSYLAITVYTVCPIILCTSKIQYY